MGKGLRARLLATLRVSRSKIQAGSEPAGMLTNGRKGLNFERRFQARCFTSTLESQNENLPRLGTPRLVRLVGRVPLTSAITEPQRYSSQVGL